MSKSKNTSKQRDSKGNRLLTPSQQWLALSLLALLVIIAVFFFGIGGFGGTGGISG
jgi:hypothetical protein